MEFETLYTEERSRTHKKLKERFIIRRNMTKGAAFRASPLFQATYTNKSKTTATTENKQFIQFIWCQWDAGGRNRETD